MYNRGICFLNFIFFRKYIVVNIAGYVAGYIVGYIKRNVKRNVKRNEDFYDKGIT